MSKSAVQLALLAIGVSSSITATLAVQIPSVKAQEICQSYRVTRTDGLYVYVHGGKRIIATLPYNYLVRVVGISDDGYWARVEYLRRDGLTGRGWVGATYLSCFQR